MKEREKEKIRINILSIRVGFGVDRGGGGL